MLPIILILPGLFGLARGVGFYGEVCFEEDVPQANFEGGRCHEMTLSPDYRISLTDGGLKGLSLVPKGLTMTDENVLAGKVRVKDKRLGGTRSLRATIKLDGSIEELSKGETEKAYTRVFGNLVGEWRKQGSEGRLDDDEEGSDEREEENPNEETKLILTESDMERLGMEGKAGPKGVTIKSNYKLEIRGHEDPSTSMSLKPTTFAKTGANTWTGKMMLKPLKGKGSPVKRGLMTVELIIPDEVAETLFDPKVDASEIQFDPLDAARLEMSKYAGKPIVAWILHDGRLDPVNGPLSTDGGFEVTVSIQPQSVEGSGRKVKARVAVRSVRRQGSREKSLGTAKITLSLTKRDQEVLSRLRRQGKVRRGDPHWVQVNLASVARSTES
ncbi:hypothetical protein FOL46_006479 [Perkinsus olseni]|uniref:Uncharacterized protein n=2 Tax=Perkinsus olseni TaxID=32597 RepID=A0A7J6MQA3_PEROL|nr:hypothetical protein FOL46_006479 [Perkinsus olseni]